MSENGKKWKKKMTNDLMKGCISIPCAFGNPDHVNVDEATVEVDLS